MKHSEPRRSEINNDKTESRRRRTHTPFIVSLIALSTLCTCAAPSSQPPSSLQSPQPIRQTHLLNGGFFAFDPHQPYTLQLGRGSGWHGLGVVDIQEDGTVKLSRIPTKANEVWEATNFTLSLTARNQIADCVVSEKLPLLDAEYSSNLVDGTQWVLVLAQAGHRKVVYFNNSFPETIQRFATKLDAILNRDGLATATWTPGGRALDKPLWQAVVDEPRE